MKAIQITQHGLPQDVLELIDIAEPAAPGPDEALLQMLYAPINPYDLRSIRGIVPSAPLPSIMGAEGVGRILALGTQVTHVRVGDLVHLPNGIPGWRERLTVAAAPLFTLPSQADPQQLAMLRVNPPTAALLLSEFAALAPGDWIVQNAANSAVGRCVIAFAKARGIHTVNLVRREEAVAQVRAAGAEHVFVEGADSAAEVARVSGNANVKLGLDGVGAMSTLILSGCVSPGGTVAVYSAMSEQPGMASSLDIIFRNITLRGFWLAYPHLHTSGRFAAALRESADLIARGALRVPVAAVYRLDQVMQAVASVGQGGKVLLQLG